MNRLEETEKRIRQDALKLIAVGVGIGFMIGLAVGVYVGYSQGNRINVVPLGPGIEV